MARTIETLGRIILLFSAVGCADKAMGPSSADREPAAVEVVVQPAAVMLATGAGLQLRVAVTGIDDTPLGTMEDVRVAWTSSDESIVGVSASGFIQATGLGTATVTATVYMTCGTHTGS
ncbi:MAG: Ig-like domain-containing protein, partial [Gemmatimonadota bacterium]